MSVKEEMRSPNKPSSAKLVAISVQGSIHLSPGTKQSMHNPVAENPATGPPSLVPMHQISQSPIPNPPNLTSFLPFQNHLSNPTVPTSIITMSRPMCRLFTPRLGASARLSQTPRTLFRNPAAGRRFASGESGPNPKPGQNPFKVWPFVAITLLGTGSYILMARSRDGSCMFPRWFQVDGAGKEGVVVRQGVSDGWYRLWWLHDVCSCQLLGSYCLLPTYLPSRLPSSSSVWNDTASSPPTIYTTKASTNTFSLQT